MGGCQRIELTEISMEMHGETRHKAKENPRCVSWTQAFGGAKTGMEATSFRNGDLIGSYLPNRGLWESKMLSRQKYFHVIFKFFFLGMNL